MFQDGTPFDAEAVKYNVERILDPATRSGEMAAHVGPVERVEVVDDTTVTLHYEAPWVTVLDAFRRVPIWSPTAAEQWGIEEFDRHLVGAGPFLLEEWVPNDHVTVRRWDGYGGWNWISREAGPARVERVTIRFIGEEAVLGNIVRTGNAHIAMNLPTAYIDDYRNTEGFSLLTGYQAGTGLQMVMNVRRPPFSDLRVRQAVLYATDQPAINDLLYDGHFLSSDGPLNTGPPLLLGRERGPLPARSRDRAPASGGGRVRGPGRRRNPRGIRHRRRGGRHAAQRALDHPRPRGDGRGDPGPVARDRHRGRHRDRARPGAAGDGQQPRFRPDVRAPAQPRSPADGHALELGPRRGRRVGVDRIRRRGTGRDRGPDQDASRTRRPGASWPGKRSGSSWRTR